MTLGYLHGLLTAALKFLHPQLHERVSLLAKTCRVGARVPLLDIGKENRVIPGALRASRTRSRCGQEVRVVGVKGSGGKVEVNFPLNPLPKAANGDGRLRSTVFEDGGSAAMVREALRRKPSLDRGIASRAISSACPTVSFPS